VLELESCGRTSRHAWNWFWFACRHHHPAAYGAQPGWLCARGIARGAMDQREARRIRISRDSRRIEL